MNDKFSQISQTSQILKDVLTKIKPTPNLKAQKQNIVKCLIAEIRKFSYNADVVGSLAKETDLAYDTDIDIFVKFPVKFKKEELGKMVIEIGEKILTDSEIDYAEHPYIKGKFKNFSVEIVPCYDLGEGIFGEFKSIATSVDRTTYHTKYIRKKIKEKEKYANLADEIRLLKQFMKNCDVYGAEAGINGFSGYLTELLCIYYGSFTDVIKKASEWKLKTFIDVENLWEGQGKILFDEPLIVIDPVDKNRNVAAAVSEENMAKFIHHCRKFLSEPSIELFFKTEKEKMTKEDVIKFMKERGTKFISVFYEHPYINPNNLYPQLEKTRKTLVKQMENFKFKIMNSSSFASRNKSMMIFEFEVFELPNVEIINGPPIDAPLNHQDAFMSHHKNTKLSGWRWSATSKRKFTGAEYCLKFLTTQKHGFGKDFLNLDGKIYCDEEILEHDEMMEALTKILGSYF